MFSAKHHKVNLTATISLSPPDNCVDNLVRLVVLLHQGETKHKFAYRRHIGGIINRIS